ncbi:hypothetical protein Tco_0494841 [Tanacetum coccineum]
MNTAVAHPQANGLVERANKSLMEGIKSRNANVIKQFRGPQDLSDGGLSRVSAKTAYSSLNVKCSMINSVTQLNSVGFLAAVKTKPNAALAADPNPNARFPVKTKPTRTVLVLNPTRTHPTVVQTTKTDAPCGCKTKPDAPLGGGRGGQWCEGGGGFGGDGDEVVRMARAVVVSWVATAVAVSGWWWRSRRVEARGMPTHRTMTTKEDKNEDDLRLNMDLLQERREATAIREARVEDQGKLGPKCEGPYRVTKAYQNGSYNLQTMGGKEVPRTWHMIDLRKCYL